MKLNRYLWLGSPLLAFASPLQAADLNVTADITTDTTWTADTTYILDKSIFVKNGATLTIQPGTTVLGMKNVGNNTYGSLVITRNGKIHAEGTSEAPIVMTAKEERDTALTPSTADDLVPADGDGGFWGGLIILGEAPINYYTGPTTNANEFSIEGFPAGSSSDILYGGTNTTDNSGVVKYVSIRFGGYVYTTGKEINGLTMGGVGSGTTIENVEVISNTDDGVEIFGGTVNTKRIAVAFCQDDSFDMDEGHQGCHQFWFALQNATGTLGDRGGEWDGGNGSDPVRTGKPYTTATIYNATFIGDSATAGGGNPGFFLDDYFAGQLHNSVIHQFSGDAITKAGDGVGNGTAPQPAPSVFSNNTWGTFGGVANLLGTLNAGGSPTGTGNSAIGTDPLLRSISRTANGLLDPRPKAASPLLTSTLSAFPARSNCFEEVDYRGAFGTSNWLDGWSYLSKNGYLGNVTEDVAVTADITSDTTWTADKNYIIDKSIFVKNGATLTIAPGTTILGSQNLANSTFGSLVITRNGKIHAEGTAENPIVMTAKEERDTDLTPSTADDLVPADGDGGFWGGLIILGNAPINYYTGPTTNANEFSIEGFPAGSSSDILYGGSNSEDNSGIVKYVSIRFGGYVYTTGKEINGLTMGGVGSGTTIEDIEVIANTDDGVEIFGGTVNTKRIAVAFCQDDSFDMDEGHQGYHQFWFALQNASGTLGDRGGEWDGGNGSDPVRTGTPHTTASIFNATFIGDSSTAGGGNPGFFLDDYFAGQLHNSVIHQFSGDAITKAGDGVGNGTAPQPTPSVFSNNTWGTFGGVANLLGTLNAAGSPTGIGNSTIGTNPLLGGIDRGPNGLLDPRPNATSPLYSSSLTSASNGFIDATNYRGAFGANNWLDGWSYLSKKGYFGNLATLPATGGQPPFADADGDGVSDTLEATAALQNLGFSVGTNNVTPTNLFSGIYTPSSILDLVAPNQVIVQKSGGNVTLSLDLFRATNLQSFTPAPALQATFPATEPTEFYRIEVSGAE